MTPEELKEFGKAEVTINRDKVGTIMASRLAEQTKQMMDAGIDIEFQFIFMRIMTSFCADIMSDMFDKLEVEDK